jgi:endonuclease YncB( thermonuclease family)
MKKTLIISLFVLLLGTGSIAASLCDYLFGDGDYSFGRSDLFPVVRVVDGDTIIVDIDGIQERIRLIGIDTPESVHPDQERNVEYGEIASSFTKEQLEGQYVSLEFDAQERDQYGRLLAYVYFDDKMFNETLLEKGHAVVSTYPPNVRYVDHFLEIETEARENEIGLWAPEFATSIPQGRSGAVFPVTLSLNGFHENIYDDFCNVFYICTIRDFFQCHFYNLNQPVRELCLHYLLHPVNVIDRFVTQVYLFKYIDATFANRCHDTSGN